MASCCVVGGGTTKDNVFLKYFTIGTNFHCTKANIICAIDEPIVNKLLVDNSDSIQFIFTTRSIQEKYNNYARCYKFDYNDYYNINSLSSGLLALALADKLGFSTIYMFGFDNLLIKSHHQTIKFNTIKNTNKNYIIS